MRARSMAALASALVVAAFVSASCNEQLPRQIDPSVPPVVAPPWGLDVRPVSPTCKAVAIPPPPEAPNAKVAYQSLTNAVLDNLVDIVAQSGRLYVVDRSGVARYLAADGTAAPTVLDLRSQISTAFGYDSGLLSIAFHPKFAQNGYVYLVYNVPHPTQPPPAGVAFTSVLGRFQSKDGGLTIDPSTEKRLIVRDQPAPNHNGNKVIFGNDGYLYFAVGDGGVDPTLPNPNAQNKNALFGKVLRIDVDTGDPYGIPPTNPFAAGGGAPEVFAYGLRNTWRISIDPATGDLWGGDVGQQSFEEINRIVNGGNYGWPILEGNTCFLMPNCNRQGLVAPLVVHTRTEATAIIGGIVYRGTAFPSLVGKYVYGDYAFGRFWSLDPSAPVPVHINDGLPLFNITSIGVDEKNEPLFLTRTNAYRLVPPPPVVPEAPAKLTATGCVDAADPTKAAAGLFPYDVNAPQWLDGAVADRFLSIPGDAPITVLPGAQLDLPVGSVAVRTLRREGKRVETQLLLRRPDVSWSAYTYAWSSDQKEAVLATAPVSIRLLSGQEHRVDPQSCGGCHDPHRTGTLRTIGLEAAQLDRPGADYGAGRLGNPLETLAHVGLLNVPVLPETYRALPSPTGFDRPEGRARAYLHANCAFCHDGVEFSKLDLRSWIPLADTLACGEISAGHPENSPLVASLRATGPGRMPPIGSTLPDEKGIEVLSGWIQSLATCP